MIQYFYLLFVECCKDSGEFQELFLVIVRVIVLNKRGEKTKQNGSRIC